MAAVAPGGIRRRFSAVVEGTGGPSQEVTWTVEGAAEGSATAIDENGILTVDAAEELGAVLTVRAASVLDPAVSGTAAVTAAGVVISPRNPSLYKGGRAQFSAEVAVPQDASREVTWAVEGGGAGTVIDADGLLTVDPGESADTLTVKAVSVKTALSAETAVSILPPAFTVTKVTLNFTSARVTIGGTSQFSAVVEGTNYPPQEVIWSVEGAGHAGTGIDETGLLTVDIGEWAERFVVRATSAGDANVSGTAAVTVLIPPVVSGSAAIGNRLYETLEEALAAAAGTEAVITIKKDLAVSSAIALDRAGTRITLKGGDGPARTITGPGALLFTLSGGSILTLDAGLTLYNGGVRVTSDSELVLKAGAKISGASGRGVIVNPYGTFTMEGGSVEGNAGGVNVQNQGAFTMSGGSVEGNRTSGGGGVYVNSQGTFTMSGGSVKGNEVTADSGSGGGVYIGSFGVFTMTGGSIEGNRITGASGSGGGVYVNNLGTFTMGGGSVDGNSAYQGGGVNVRPDGMFTLQAGSVKNHRDAYRGGGVYVHETGRFTMEGGSVEGNSASHDGGGVYVYNNATFTMSGGSVKGNSSLNGSGIYIANNTTFTMSGGSVEGNSAGATGGGVLLNANSSITKTGGTIYGSDAAEDSQKNVVTGSASGGAAVYVDFSFTTDVSLEKTVDGTHNLTKTSSHTTTVSLTGENGWSE